MWLLAGVSSVSPPTKYTFPFRAIAPAPAPGAGSSDL